MSCKACGKVLRSDNKGGYCKLHAHHVNRQQDQSAYEDKFCGKCGSKLKSGAKHGYCDAHLRLSPSYRVVTNAYRRGLNYRNHHLTLEQYEGLKAKQGGKCLCGRTQSSKLGALHIDHDHACCPGTYSCGKCVRGLLCDNCNLALGKLGDDPALLRLLYGYLKMGGVPLFLDASLSLFNPVGLGRTRTEPPFFARARQPGKLGNGSRSHAS